MGRKTKKANNVMQLSGWMQEEQIRLALELDKKKEKDAHITT